MIVIDYKKESKKFTIHISDYLGEDHINFLKIFISNGNDESLKFSVDELLKLDDVSNKSFYVYHELQDWGILKSVYDSHECKDFISLTQVGKILLKKLFKI